MVTVANAGNAADTNIGSVFGAVAYSYWIGKYDVTGSQYTAFLNAVGKSDTYALYIASIGHRHQCCPNHPLGHRWHVYVRCYEQQSPTVASIIRQPPDSWKACADDEN